MIVDVLPPAYVYLLGMYLGDGCLSAHPRGVFKLRISLDARYPAIAAECERAMRAVMPRNRIGRVGYGTWHELFAYSKSWPCLFPQHGPGRKHERKIALTDWQRRLVARWPALLLRGLIHSDGCRFQNTGSGWSHPRYSFANSSDDIASIFCEACDLMGLRWTVSGEKTIYISRKADVATLDRFVGPKDEPARLVWSPAPVLIRPPDRAGEYRGDSEAADREGGRDASGGPEALSDLVVDGDRQRQA
jgi:hypothetical protein